MVTQSEGTLIFEYFIRIPSVSTIRNVKFEEKEISPYFDDSECNFLFQTVTFFSNSSEIGEIQSLIKTFVITSISQQVIPTLDIFPTFSSLYFH